VDQRHNMAIFYRVTHTKICPRTNKPEKHHCDVFDYRIAKAIKGNLKLAKYSDATITAIKTGLSYLITYTNDAGEKIDENVIGGQVKAARQAEECIADGYTNILVLTYPKNGSYKQYGYLNRTQGHSSIGVAWEVTN